MSLTDASSGDLAERLFGAAWEALGGPETHVEFTGTKAFAVPFGVTQLGAAGFAAVGAALAELLSAATGDAPEVVVDRELASGWLRMTSIPVGDWQRPSPWHDVSTDYPTADGRWVRLQANYPHLRDAAARALGVSVDRDAWAAVIAAAGADEIEQAIVDGGGAAAASRTLAEWAAHEQGRSVAVEPLIDRVDGEAVTDSWRPTPGRPLSGIRILDITRVLAGPMATRCLAGYGAEVLRIDPAGYAEPNGDSGGDLTWGKRCAFLALDTDEGRARFLELLAGADVFVHGLRPGALEALGLGEEVRRSVRPGLVDVTLDAYGWSGPWNARRGFDTLVQTSSGISTELMHRFGLSQPRLLPAQVLDFATGYLMAASVIRGLTRRMTEGRGSSWRLALARTASLLISAGEPPAAPELTVPLSGPVEDRVFSSPQGAYRRLVFPLTVHGSPLFWERPGDPYGSSVPLWSTQPGSGRSAA